MKPIVTTLVALGLVFGFSAPVLAATPKTKVACEKAHMTWDDVAKKCNKGSM